MKTRLDKADELVREYLSGALTDKAPVDFTARVMHKIESTEMVSKMTFSIWMKENFYYVLAIIFIGGMGFYFSGPYNLPGSAGVSNSLHVFAAWIQYIVEGLFSWGVPFKWSNIATVLIISLFVFVILDFFVRRSIKTQYQS